MAAVALVARPEFSVMDFVAFIPLPLIASPKNTDSTTTFLSPRGSLRQVLTRSFLLRFRLRLACPPLYGRLCVVQIGKARSEEHTSELQSRGHLVCRLLLEETDHLMLCGLVM